MRSRFLSSWIAGLVIASGGWAGNSASAAFVTPDGATYPFESWQRGDADSTYAEWGAGNTAATGFSDDSAAAGVQDVDSPNFNFNAATADVIETTGASFLTSGFNIYSFSAATFFDVTIPSYGYGNNWNTRVVAQIRTQGTELDLSSVTLSGGNIGAPVAASHVAELHREALGGFGGALVDTMFVWDVTDFNPASFLLEFNASGSSMSLDMLAVDTFAVPEPASVALVGLAGCVLVGLRRRTR